MSNKIQTGIIKFPQISDAQIYNVLITSTVPLLRCKTQTEDLYTHSQRHWPFSSEELKDKMFSFFRCVSQIQTTEVSIESTAQPVHAAWT